MLGAASEREIVIAQNMTTLTLHLSRSIGRRLRPGDEIIVTRMEHEGNISPWLLLAEDLGIAVKWLPFDRGTWRIEPEDLKPLLSERTRLLALNYSSNMTGSVNDVATLSSLAKQAGALVYVDAVQLVPHRLPDVHALGCDFLACSSYKFFGPHAGVMVVAPALRDRLTPLKVRPASMDMPWRHTPGTPSFEAQAGTQAANISAASAMAEFLMINPSISVLCKQCGRSHPRLSKSKSGGPYSDWLWQKRFCSAGAGRISVISGQPVPAIAG